LSVEEGLIKGLLLKGVLKSVDQQYVIADGRTDNFFETRVRFVNLDLSLVYSISGDVSVSLTALNALDNSKGFIEESLANSLGESVAGVDQYLAERVYTLSAKVQF
jgi:hypothetical protein